MAPPRSFVRFKVRVLAGARAAPYLGFVAPCLAVPRRRVPRGARWVHELALGGLRIQAHLAQGRVTLYAQGGLDCTERLAPIAQALAKLPANHAIIDGETIGAAREHAALPREGRGDRMAYSAFDLLYLDGFDVRDAGLVERRRILGELLTEAGLPDVVVSEPVERDGDALLRQARAMRLAGIVAKDRDAPYRSGADPSWVLVACAPRRRVEPS